MSDEWSYAAHRSSRCASGRDLSSTVDGSTRTGHRERRIIRERRVVDGQFVTGGDCSTRRQLVRATAPQRRVARVVGEVGGGARPAARGGRRGRWQSCPRSRLVPPRRRRDHGAPGVTRGGLRAGQRPHLLPTAQLRSGRARRSMRRPPTRRDGARRRLAVVRSPRRQSNAGGAPTVGQAVPRRARLEARHERLAKRFG